MQYRVDCERKRDEARRENAKGPSSSGCQAGKAMVRLLTGAARTPISVSKKTSLLDEYICSFCRR
jgi:hypothetical protein